ncbi:MAG: matrixin family metalloprotease [Myxococcales bacterium]|nr:matrixin family metalloprotease [Myxococcales bacterium]
MSRSMLRVALFASLLAGATVGELVAPTPALAWECLTGSCPRWCRTVPYGISRVSDDLGEEVTVTETRRGMDDWTRVSCTNLTTNYTGRSAATAGAGDGQSIIGWVESGWRHGSSAIGVTGPRWDGRNCIVEADMEMNGVNYTWITGPGSGSRVNTYSIALHEGGHYFGLGHSNDRNASMYFAYSGGISAINTDDSNGICTLYPGMGGGTVDCTTAGCPSGQECVSGACRPIMGDGSLCSPCRDSSECGGAGDFCLQYPTGGSFCGRACSGSDCGSGYQCVNVGGRGQCVGVVGTQPSCEGATPRCRNDSECSGGQRCNTTTGTCEAAPTDRAGLGESCEEDADCNSGLCASTPTGGVCSQSCNGLDRMSCPAGFYCDGRGGCDTGLCMAGTAGGAALGASCSADTDCASLMCDGTVCASPCRPDSDVSGCPMGFLCRPGAVAGCGACRSEADLGAPGDACEINEDCRTGICVVLGDERFCSDFCTEAMPCPDRFTCTPLGEEAEPAICVPPRRRDEGGCGCRVPGADGGGEAPWALLLVPAVVLWRRTRRRR